MSPLNLILSPKLRINLPADKTVNQGILAWEYADAVEFCKPMVGVQEEGEVGGTKNGIEVCVCAYTARQPSGLTGVTGHTNGLCHLKGL